MNEWVQDTRTHPAERCQKIDFNLHGGGERRRGIVFTTLRNLDADGGGGQQGISPKEGGVDVDRAAIAGPQLVFVCLFIRWLCIRRLSRYFREVEIEVIHVGLRFHASIFLRAVVIYPGLIPRHTVDYR